MFDWRVLFWDKIIQNGIMSKNAGAVKSLEINDEGLSASVQGEEELYSVKLDSSFTKMTCTCPCDFNCRHMVAVFLTCEESEDKIVEQFFEKYEGSPFSEYLERRRKWLLDKKAATEAKARREAEREARRLQKLQDAPRIQAEEEEKKRLAEQRRMEREKHEEEVAARRAEREKRRLEKLKEEEEKRKAREEERKRKQAEWEAYKKAHEAEWAAAKKEKERQDRLREAKREEEARLAEPCRQKRLDRESREKLMKLPPEIKKQVKKELREVDERITILEEAEREPEMPLDEDLSNHHTMQETGWYYPEPKFEDDD